MFLLYQLMFLKDGRNKSFSAMLKVTFVSFCQKQINSKIRIVQFAGFFSVLEKVVDGF